MTAFGDRLIDRGRLLRHRPLLGWRLNWYRRSALEAMFRNRARATYIGDGTVLCRVLGRYKMYVPADDMSVAAHLMVEGYWEIWVVEALARLLRQRMVVADVGANLGVLTLMMAGHCSDGHVHAFEPNPEIAGYLRRNLTVNGFEDRATVHATALGQEDGEASLIVPERMAGGGHLVTEAAVQGRPHATVPVVRLDQVPGARDAELVKIDAEGSEPAIWAGMAGMIAGTRLHTVLLEFSPVRLPDPAGFLARIEAAGFNLGVIDPMRGVRPLSEGIAAGGEHMLLLRR